MQILFFTVFAKVIEGLWNVKNIKVYE